MLKRFVGCLIRGNSVRFSSNHISDVPEKVQDENMPVEMDNPYVKPQPQCILCRTNVNVNYKNVRLLSQFVSEFTGRVYTRNVTGLCERQQKLVEAEIWKARECGLMPYAFKMREYLNDPPLFNPSRPIRPHNY